MTDQRELLRKNGLFASMNDEVIEQFLAMAEERTYPADALIYAEMGGCKEIYFVLEGELSHLFALANAGEDLEPIVIGPGELSNAVALVDAGPAYISCTAAIDVRLLVWQANAWRDICDQNPAVGYGMASAVARMLVHRLQQLNQRLLDRVEWGIL